MVVGRGSLLSGETEPVVIPLSTWKYPAGGMQVECPFKGDRIYREFVKAGGTGNPANIGRPYAKCGSCGEDDQGKSLGGFLWLDEPHDGVLPCKGSPACDEYWSKKKPRTGGNPRTQRNGGQVRILQRDPKDNKEAMVANVWGMLHDLLDSKIENLKAQGLDWVQMKQFLDWNAPVITDTILELLVEQMKEETKDEGENMGD